VPEDPGRRATGEVDGAVFHAQQELSAELTALVPDAVELLSTTMTTSQLAGLLEHALAVMHGNRTPLGTWVRPDDTLARLPPTTAPRLLSREAFELIRVAAADESFRRLDALAERFPDSSMPVVHRGELHLWLGNYAEARADLEHAVAIRRQTRWAWYGLAWLDIVAGDPERGLATCAQGIEVMSNTEGPPAFACRGEAYRLLGRLDEAREQLQRSCELNPTRLSAWVDLAIVHGAAGDHEQQAAVFGRLVRAAPALVSHAARELGEDVFTSVVLAAPVGEDTSVARILPAMIHRVLEHVLVMMRGNRASSLVTYFTADGRMHHVPRFGGQHSSPAAAQHAVDKVRTVVLRALDGGVRSVARRSD
jgi:tetratricopeptide (TPR) repeat protein